jgi:hypothetical protein
MLSRLNKPLHNVVEFFDQPLSTIMDRGKYQSGKYQFKLDLNQFEIHALSF